MKLTTTKSKSVVSGILIAAALAFTATTAMAATTAHKSAATHVVHTRHFAAAKRRPSVRQQPSLAQFFGLFGLPIPVAVASHAARGTVSADTGGYDPSFDSPSPAVAVDNSQSQAAIDASDQATQQMDQDIQDMNASNAAAEAQNDAANAATQQYLINNGM